MSIQSENRSRGLWLYIHPLQEHLASIKPLINVIQNQVWPCYYHQHQPGITWQGHVQCTPLSRNMWPPKPYKKSPCLKLLPAIIWVLWFVFLVFICVPRKQGRWNFRLKYGHLKRPSNVKWQVWACVPQSRSVMGATWQMTALRGDHFTQCLFRLCLKGHQNMQKPGLHVCHCLCSNGSFQIETDSHAESRETGLWVWLERSSIAWPGALSWETKEKASLSPCTQNRLVFPTVPE